MSRLASHAVREPETTSTSRKKVSKAPQLRKALKEVLENGHGPEISEISKIGESRLEKIAEGAYPLSGGTRAAVKKAVLTLDN